MADMAAKIMGRGMEYTMTFEIHFHFFSPVT